MNYFLKISLLGFTSVVELGLAPGNMGKNFQITENLYDSRNETKFKSKNACTVRYGETVRYGPFAAQRIWTNIPKEYKECNSVKEFKTKITFWYPESYIYIYHIGYIGKFCCRSFMLLLFEI